MIPAAVPAWQPPPVRVDAWALPSSTSLSPGASDPTFRMTQAVSQIFEQQLQGTLESRRSGTKGNQIVADLTQQSRLVLLSMDSVSAKRRSIYDILVAHSLSNTNGAKYTQVTYKDVVDLVQGFFGIDIAAFTPLEFVQSQESARAIVRGLLAWRKDTPYDKPRLQLLNNNPSRWKAAIEQVFLFWADIFVVHQDTLMDLNAMAARVISMLTVLPHWTYHNAMTLVRAMFDQLDDLLLRVGHDVMTVSAFREIVRTLPQSPPGSILAGTYTAMSAEAHSCWARGLASHAEVDGPGGDQTNS